MSRTYAVTGVGSGIGQATKEVLENAGNRVIGIARNGADVNVDLSDPGQRATVADAVAELSGGTLDGIIAVAGTTEMTTQALQVNFYGVRDLLVGLRPQLLTSSAPRAAVVTSISVVHPNHPELTRLLLEGEDAAALALGEDLVANNGGGYMYTSSKRAVAEWVRVAALSSDWAGEGIPLNSVAPGTFITKMVAPHLATPEGRAMVSKSTPMPLNGPGEPQVVARLLAWLTSEENTHVTGQSIFVDGGAEATLRGPHVFEGAVLDFS
ncbi:SDR family oxidoreductase [Microbacterium sp. X-17]|uniref:SDR family oxidoreductase n=1 Tax=Microbacterium sp. X-17 TaxID=3144404 RepID=UPI0031F5A1C4